MRPGLDQSFEWTPSPRSEEAGRAVDRLHRSWFCIDGPTPNSHTQPATPPWLIAALHSLLFLELSYFTQFQKMKLKQRLVMVAVIAVIFTVLFLISVLEDWDEVGHDPTPLSKLSRDASRSQDIHEQPPSTPTSNPTNSSRVMNTSLKAQLQKSSSVVSRKDPWTVWRGWVTADYLYPVNAFYSSDMNHILSAMASYPITSWGVGHKGTQLKATAMLGAQRVVFKPKR